jgi:hypothetical protein
MATLFPIDGADFHMPTIVLRDYITNAEVAEVLRNPGVSQKIKDVDGSATADPGDKLINRAPRSPA